MTQPILAVASTEVAVPVADTPAVVPAEAIDKEPTDLEKWLTAEAAWVNKYDAGWVHQRVEYKGDNLAVRKPTDQGISGFSLATSKFTRPETKNNITGLFIERHLGPDSYDRVMERLMDPDDPGYTTASVADVMGLIVDLYVNEAKAEITA